jgi:hypothetical protein
MLLLTPPVRLRFHGLRRSQPQLTRPIHRNPLQSGPPASRTLPWETSRDPREYLGDLVEKRCRCRPDRTDDRLHESLGNHCSGHNPYGATDPAESAESTSQAEDGQSAHSPNKGATLRQPLSRPFGAQTFTETLPGTLTRSLENRGVPYPDHPMRNLKAFYRT